MKMKQSRKTHSRKRLVAGGLVFVGVVLLLMMAWAGGPTYGGRSLTTWLEEYERTPSDETNQLTQARNAIRAIGPKKSLPILLRLVSTKDSSLDRWLSSKFNRFDSDFLKWRSADECELEAVAGFEVFGSNAAPAVAALTKLLDDKDKAFAAARCLGEIGKPAKKALCRCLTNSSPEVRHWAVPALAGATEDAEIYISQIKGCLIDSDSSVRFITVISIGEQQHAPDLAVPLLINALNDPDASVSAQAAGAIASFGTNGAPAFSALTSLIAPTKQVQARAALNALAAIAPFEAIPVLSNTVVNESALSGAALKSLKAIAPELCLRMTLAELRSPDARRRLQAINVAGAFQPDTPGIAAALKLAAEDDDPEIARRVKMTMRQMLREQTKPVIVRLADDPSYQGKPLSEWLQLREDNSLSTNGVEALRHMSTNVIPSLLLRIEYRDPVFGLDDSSVSMEGVSGLLALGDQAKPALPRLYELMDSDNETTAFSAMAASLGTGRDAIPFLLKGLTNQFANVRNEAANLITGDWSAQFPEERKKAIPFLLKLLDDPDPFVRGNATNQLKELTPHPTARAGIR